MKRFNFRLETLLRHRKNQEDRERGELSRARNELNTEHTRREDLERQKLGTIEDLRNASVGELDPLDFELGRLYLNRIGTEIADSEKRLAKLDQAVQDQTQVVVEARKKTKVLDTLKTKHHKAYQTEVDKVEQKAVDEIVVTRYAGKDPG
jgi:flagellar protein FliJ